MVRVEVLNFIGNRLCDARDRGKLLDTAPMEWPESLDKFFNAKENFKEEDLVITIKIEHCPKCGEKLLYAPGIGWFCPSMPDVCDVADGIYPALSGCIECYPGKPGLDPRTRYDGWRLICPHSIFKREL